MAPLEKPAGNLPRKGSAKTLMNLGDKGAIMNQDLMKCKICAWFMPKVARIDPRGPDMQAPTYDVGRCRRHAPTSGYPGVFVNDWCGDHKLDEEKL